MRIGSRVFRSAAPVLALLFSVLVGLCRYGDFDRVCGRMRYRAYLWGICVGWRTEETRISELYREIADPIPPEPEWEVDRTGFCWAHALLPGIGGGPCTDTRQKRGFYASRMVAEALDRAAMSPEAKRAVLRRFFGDIRRDGGVTWEHLRFAFELESWLADFNAAAAKSIEVEDLPESLK